MRAKNWLLLAGLCALCLAPPALRAHEDEGAEGMGMGMGMHGGMDKMKEKLGLSEDQAAKMKQAGENNRDAMKAIHDKMVLDRQKLKDLVEKKSPDAELSAALGALKQDRQAMQDQMNKHMAAVEAILKPQQQAKMALAMGGMHGGGKGGWKHKDWKNKDWEKKGGKEAHEHKHDGDDDDDKD